MIPSIRREGDEVVMGTKTQSPNRMSKYRKYAVTIHREVEYTAVLEVEARSAEEAEDLAKMQVDAPKANYFREGDVIDETVKARLIRD